MVKSLSGVCGLLLCLAFAITVDAQLSLVQTAESPSPTPQSTPTPDPYGRATPRGTISGLVKSAHGEDPAIASRYLQLTLQQEANAVELIHDLNALLDRYYHLPLTAISDSPDGAIDDGLPLDREKVGPLKIGDQDFYIVLVRVTQEPDGGKIWLISSETLDEIPGLVGAIEQTWIERVMPEALVRKTIFEVSYAQLIVWAATLALTVLVLWLISQLVAFLGTRVLKESVRRRRFATRFGRLRWPSIVFATLLIHLIYLSIIGFSLRFRIFYLTFLSILLVIAFAWLLARVLSVSSEYLLDQMKQRERASARSLTLLGERMLKALVVVGAGFMILIILGVQTSTALAGVGIVGVALALGAQKTVENFLGGVFLLTDKALAVGDLCSISNRLGFVEDITLRSVRLRTLEQTLLSIPAGVLSQDSIENFSTRGKILMQTMLRLRYGTTAEQLKSILEGIRELIAQDNRIETDVSRVRLVNFGVRAIEIELFTYILTARVPEFFAIREELLLKVAEIVEGSGSGFAASDSSAESTQDQQRVS